MKTPIIVLLISILLLLIYLFIMKKREGMDSSSPSIQSDASGNINTVILSAATSVKDLSNNTNNVSSLPSSTNYSATTSIVKSQQATAMVNQIKQMIQNNSSAIKNAFDPNTGQLKEGAILPIKNGINMILTNMQTQLTSSNINQLLDNVIDLATTLKSQIPVSPK